METKICIKPVFDTYNTYTQPIEFVTYTTDDGYDRVVINLDDRTLTFNLTDLERMLRIARAVLGE